MATIFFDFDGVLIQSRFRDRSFLWTTDIEADLKIPKPLLKQLFHQPEWDQILSGSFNFKVRIQDVLAKASVETSTEGFIDYWLSKDLNWRFDVLTFASDLKAKGHSIYIATNQDRIRGAHIAQQPEIRAFDGIFSSCSLGITKLHSDFFRRIQDELGFSADGNFYVIDDDTRNLDAAERIGWKSFHFNPDLDDSHSLLSLECSLKRALSIDENSPQIGN